MHSLVRTSTENSAGDTDKPNFLLGIEFQKARARKAPRGPPALAEGTAGAGEVPEFPIVAPASGAPARPGTVAVGGAPAAAPAQGAGAGVAAGGDAAPTAARGPPERGEDARPARRPRVGELAAAAAEGRALQEDPSERQARLDLAAHNRLEELRGQVMGRLRATGRERDIPMNLNLMSEQQLRQMYDRLLPAAFRGGDD